jgi:hypothetical protein
MCGMEGAGDRRREERVELAMECMLRRRAGSPISCETVDVGTGGMSVCSERPLATDELLAFDLGSERELHGRARVLRQQGHQVYALRFEGLPDDARAGIEQLLTRAA